MQPGPCQLPERRHPASEHKPRLLSSRTKSVVAPPCSLTPEALSAIGGVTYICSRTECTADGLVFRRPLIIDRVIFVSHLLRNITSQACPGASLRQIVFLRCCNFGQAQTTLACGALHSGESCNLLSNPSECLIVHTQ